MNDLIVEGGKPILITISSKVLDELTDFAQDDEVQMNIKAIVKKIDIPQPKELKEGEKPPDYSENPEAVESESFVTLEIVAGEVVNEKPERKRAKDLGLKSPKDISRIQKKHAEKKTVEGEV